MARPRMQGGLQFYVSGGPLAVRNPNSVIRLSISTPLSSRWPDTQLVYNTLDNRQAGESVTIFFPPRRRDRVHAETANRIHRGALAAMLAEEVLVSIDVTCGGDDLGSILNDHRSAPPCPDSTESASSEFVIRRCGHFANRSGWC